MIEEECPLKEVGLDASELYALARIDFDKGDLEPALRKIKPVLAQAEPQPDALSLGARVYAQLRMPERASALFKRYLIHRPDAVDEGFQLGMLDFERGASDEALTQWSRVLEVSPTHPPALFFSALALARGNRIADARRPLDVLLQSAGEDNLYFGHAKNLLQSIEKQDTAQAHAQVRVPVADPAAGIGSNLTLN